MVDLPGTQLTVSALGTSVRIVLPTEAASEAVARIRAAWQGALIECASPDRDVIVDEIHDLDRVLEQLSVRVTLEALAHRRGELVMFHAAGIALEDGRVVAFVGPSGRGKTTLSRELGRHFGYVSDETIGVDADLNVYAYRKPLSVVQEAGPKKQVAPADAGLRELPDAPLRLAALVLLDRVAGADPSLERVDLVDALADLVPQLSYLGDLDAPLQRVARLVDGVGGVYRLRYAEASSVAPEVASFLDARSDSTSPVWAHWDTRHSGDGAYSWASIDDAIRLPDALAVLSEGTVRILAGIAPDLVAALVAGTPRVQIVEDLTERFGVPPDGNPDDLVAAAIVELEAAGIVRLSR